MTEHNKENVYQCYNQIVDWFDNARNKNLIEIEYLDLILSLIPAGGSILDLGCGTGEPLAQFFINRGYNVTGIDASQKMIELCKKRFPHGYWLICDMRKINLNKKFNVILAWHSFFHLDQESQRKMFQIFDSHLLPGGILAFTSGDENGEVWSDNGGQLLYHASLAENEYNQLLKNFSFKVLVHKVRDPNCGEATVWVAKKS